MTELERLCERLGVRISCQLGAPDNPEFSSSIGYTVRLRYKRRQLTTPFYMGAALDHEPSAADVLSCLISDATLVMSASNFEEWARNLGYDPDSRKAETAYKACRVIAPKVRQLLGEDFGLFQKAEH